MSKIKFGWHMPSFAVDNSSSVTLVRQISNVLRRIQSTFDTAWMDDHVHPWADFVSRDADVLECLTTIAHLATAFPQIRFGSMVICQSYRNPGLTAKMAANLQLLTGGRFILGLGAGWLEEEYLAYGYEFPKASVRIAQLDETIQIVRKLWTQSPASFEGEYYHLRDAYCDPKPEPLPPIMVGGGGEKLTLGVVAKQADWWNFHQNSPDTYAHKLDALRAHCERVGRDYNDIVKTYGVEVLAIAETEAEARRIAEASPYQDNYPIIGTPNQVAEQLRPYIELGVEHIIIRCVDFPSTAGIELFSQAVIPQLSS